MLSNLFYGWGYNFYRRENELHADDLLIRGKLSQLLRDSRMHVALLHGAFLRKHLPRGRGLSFPNPGAVGMGMALERARQELEAMEIAVRTAAAPEMGQVGRHDREERGTLTALVALDGEALHALLTLRDAIARYDDGAEAAAGIDELLRASHFAALWSRRQALLADASA